MLVKKKCLSEYICWMDSGFIRELVIYEALVRNEEDCSIMAVDCWKVGE
jgi:hypothetical protein